MDFTYSLDLHFHASHIDANHIGASTYENHIRAFRRPEGQTIPISDALSFILHRVTDSNILKSRGQAIMQAQKDAFQHFNIAFLGCLQFQSYEKKPYPKANLFYIINCFYYLAKIYSKPGFFRELVNFAIYCLKHFATGNFRVLRISKFREFQVLVIVTHYNISKCTNYLIKHYF